MATLGFVKDPDSGPSSLHPFFFLLQKKCHMTYFCQVKLKSSRSFKWGKYTNSTLKNMCFTKQILPAGETNLSERADENGLLYKFTDKLGNSLVKCKQLTFLWIGLLTFPSCFSSWIASNDHGPRYTLKSQKQFTGSYLCPTPLRPQATDSRHLWGLLWGSAKLQGSLVTMTIHLCRGLEQSPSSIAVL